MGQNKHLSVIGIGASAGGFEALTKFFKILPDNTGAAYVIIQHLSPTYDSHCDKLLSNFTKMPVKKVTDKMPVAPNHVYVIPENKILKINSEGLYLEKRETKAVPNFTVDLFFESLASTFKENSVGVVLSGTGSDGARGVLDIKGNGGMVMVQSPESASFDSMPTVSISSDHPDYIGTPEQLARELTEYLKNPSLLDRDKIQMEDFTDKVDPLKEIISLISSYSGVNFKSYKPGTIVRRIEKRMKINHLLKLSEYKEFLQQHPKEALHLFDDLLIGVTRFFRDPEAFRSLEENVIPQLLENSKAFAPIRIWVTSCSTGEEAYSLAMLFENYISENNLDAEFKIFATDVNQRALDIASEGIYSQSITEDISSGKLQKFFNPLGDRFQIKKEIRRRIIFSKHNLLHDPPFIRLDLISCRNLFIYLNDEAQNKLLHSFNYALNEKGYFFLGLNESNNEQDILFDAVDAKNKIFVSKGNNNLRPFRPSSFINNDISHLQQATPSFRYRPSSPATEEHYADLVVEKFAPPSILLSAVEDVVYTTGNLDKFLQFPNRRSDLNVYNMLTGALLLVFRNGIRHIQEGKPKIKFKDTLIERGKTKYKADIVFSKIEKRHYEHNSFFILVEFHEGGKVTEEDDLVEVVTRDKYSQSEIENLEMELKRARRELHFTADELETINEELQSSNEEMQSANEELQSTNEELQSSNEELHTVNVELKDKIDALTILHDDMLNLFHSTQIATVFLDSELNIRKFTPPAKQYFNIRESDVGRPIHHYSYNFTHDGLEADIHDVLNNLQPIEHEVEQKEGKYSIMRILPYKTESRQIKGVVITFTDITELKLKNKKLSKITQELSASEQHLKSLLDNTPDLIARFNKDLHCIFINKALQEVNQQEETPEKCFPIASEVEKMNQLLREVIESGKERTYYFHHQSPKGGKSYYTRLIPELDVARKHLKSVLSISTDITALKEAEQKIIANNKQLSEMYERMDNFVHAVAHDLRAPLVNLKLLTQLIDSVEDLEQKKQFIQKIGSSVGKLDNTLNGLIQIIEMENESEMACSEINLEEKVKLIQNELSSQIKASGATIERDFSALSSFCYVEAYLESILKNMLSNAIKYRFPDRKPIIELKTEKAGDKILLSISDNGKGMNMEEHGHNLFKPFKRFHKETEGMGVGLYVIKYMVTKNGGHIEVESKVDEGTTFKIYLKPYVGNEKDDLMEVE